MGRITQSIDSTTTNKVDDNVSIHSSSQSSITSVNSTAEAVTELRSINQQILDISTELKKLQLRSYELTDKISSLTLDQRNINSE